jgi:hypothetical protein
LKAKSFIVLRKNALTYYNAGVVAVNSKVVGLAHGVEAKLQVRAKLGRSVFEIFFYILRRRASLGRAALELYLSTYISWVVKLF